MVECAPTCFAHEKPACSDVPVLDADLEVGVQATGSDAAAVDCSAAETADIGDVGQEIRNESGLFCPKQVGW